MLYIVNRNDQCQAVHCQALYKWGPPGGEGKLGKVTRQSLARIGCNCFIGNRCNVPSSHIITSASCLSPKRLARLTLRLEGFERSR